MDFYKLTVKQSLDELNVNEAGLSRSEANLRLSKYGRNVIEVKTDSIWKVILEPFRNIFMILLFVVALVSLWHGAIIDALIVIAIILINAIIFYVQHYSTSRILRSLNKYNPHLVDVLRDEKVVSLETSDIVPGDIVLLNEGDKVPADLRLISLDNLKVDEAQLTGESLPIEKQIEPIGEEREIYARSNMLFQGSFVVSGEARALVVSTGNSTEFGKIAGLSAKSSQKNPIQVKIDRLVNAIIRVVIAMAIVAFGLAIYRGMELVEAVRYVLALSVSAVPESLPVAITVVLVLGMSRMAKKKALVKNMHAIETIGGVNVIATDKTGTLTKNKLTVQDIWSLSKRHESVLINCLAHSANLSGTKSHDPLDIALEEYVAKVHKKVKMGQLEKSLPFDQAYAMSGNLIELKGELSLWVKGSPESIVSRCDLSNKEKDDINRVLHSYAGNGFRVIAFAHQENVKKISSFSKLSDKTKLVFDGLVAIADILRPEAKKAINDAKKAGIKVYMITGDHFETAFHIAKELGIVSEQDEVFDSRKMKDLSDEDLAQIIEESRVFSRVIPEDKYRILTVLKKSNITAMTGDGVNDVPALANSHVGVAMGSGSSIAKDAGDIILLNDNFKSIVDAVHEGRTILANIKRMVAYLLSTNAGEVIISLGSLVLGIPIPILAVQILWVNLATDTCMVIPLGLEPGERHNMNRPPKSLNSPLFSKFMASRIVFVAIVMATIVLMIYRVELNAHGYDYARTVAFHIMVIMQWANAFCYRSDYESLIYRIKRFSKSFYIGLASAVALQLLTMTDLFKRLLQLETIMIIDLIKYGLIAFVLSILAIELHKWIGRKFFDKGHIIRR